MASLTIELLGWIGTTMVVAAYLLLTRGKLESKSRAYQLLNLIGALGIGLNAFMNRAYPPKIHLR